MRLYLVAWRSSVAVLGGFGVLTTWVSVPPSLLGPFMAYVLMLGLLLPTARRRRRVLLGLPPREPEAPLPGALRSAVLSALGGLAVLGLVVPLGAAAIALLVLLAAASPPALKRYRRHERRPAEGDQSQPTVQGEKDMSGSAAPSADLSGAAERAGDDRGAALPCLARQLCDVAAVQGRRAPRSARRRALAVPRRDGTPEPGGLRAVAG